MHDAHPPVIILTAEASGYVLTCECQWTRYERTRPAADDARREHARKCKGPKVKPEPKVTRSARASWDDREGATWIDSL